jgi:1-deoxy-D-xylulose-5-phosphate reductoisomerase
MVNYKDGTTLAQLSLPDMKGPIGYALNFPRRHDLMIRNIDFVNLGSLEFFEPDRKKFYALDLVERVGKDLRLGVIFNAAKEVAMEKFITGELNFLDMASLVEIALNEATLIQQAKYGHGSFDEIVNVDLCTRTFLKNISFKD